MTERGFYWFDEKTGHGLFPTENAARQNAEEHDE